jgi:hypothetical protein
MVFSALFFVPLQGKKWSAPLGSTCPNHYVLEHARYINVFLIIQTEYCAKQQGHKKTKVHTHSLSLSLSPSLEDQQEVQTKLLPANCNPIIISPCFLRKLVLC